MFRPDEFRSISFRVALIYTGFFVASVLAILGTTYVVASSELSETLRAEIGDDVARLRAGFASGGEAALKDDFDDLGEAASEDRFFLVLDAGGRRIAGNVPKELWRAGWQSGSVAPDIVASSPSLVAAAGHNHDHEMLFLALGERIGPYDVLVGRNSHIVDETQEIILSAMLIGGVVSSVLALLGGFLVSRGPTRRVDEIALTTRQIVDGRLDLRLPVSGRGDELDRLAADINAMLARIETLLASLKQVSTDIAHDLRTPLARLRQRLDSVRRRARTPEEYEVAIDAAIEESDAAIETFHALLRIAQIEAGTRRSRFRPLDLRAVVRRTAEVYEEVAADAGHRLDIAELGAAHVEGDEELLTQLLANLIENAINHVPPPGRIAISLHASDGVARLDVADDGPGVPDGERAKIFQRLYRLDQSRTTPGSGLGLALVAAIAELHGGSAEALDAAPGLRVRVTLPLAADRG
ncbi:HAMP domain-containing sensor histidine kinase [Jiella sonneratiae]|uniref:histidine kinase n=1 Tax=Jiella sonneratiae TaxID=2816856 RepID=A0ABS3J570_9HYPH|nr:ATP-binding protein [Jiella sonneratiae]MBO0904285.1 HAMP domain-containing protein [Jiella sonneratiae]